MTESSNGDDDYGGDAPPVPRRATITTVAETAGVSIATVSRVLSGSASVNADLAGRVRRAAEDLSYRPSGAARGLARGSLRNIGVMLPDLGNSYFFDIVKQMHHDAASAGYRMLVADTSGEPDEELATAVDLLGQVDGLILLSSRIPNDGLRSLSRQGTHTVLVNRAELGVDLPMVAVDGFTAMMELCAHLSQFGHRRVAYLSGSALSWQNRERWRGVEMARVLGIEACAVECDGTAEAGYAAVDEALMFEPTALLCFNDLCAVGALSRLRERGFHVPDDISVTGFDDIEIARHMDPGLTSAVSPKRRLGELAWGLTRASLDRGQVVSPPLLEAELVVRGSSGPAPESTGA